MSAPEPPEPVYIGPMRVRIRHQPKNDRHPFVVERRVGWFWLWHDALGTEVRAVTSALSLRDELDRKARPPRIVREFA